MFGFYRMAAATPRTYLADPAANAREIINLYRQADDNGAAAVIFPEMSITGYTIGDLVFQRKLLEGTKTAALEIAAATLDRSAVAIAGMPVEFCGRIYNSAVIFQAGEIVGIVPKKQLANYREFNEKRYFSPGSDADTVNELVVIGDQEVPFGCRQIFYSGEDFSFGVEICEDLWSVTPPSNDLALAGALAIFNPAACTEQALKARFRRDLVKTQSAKLNAAYVLSTAGVYESTSDAVFAGHSIIAAAGEIITEGERFARSGRVVYADIDLQSLRSLRRTDSSFCNHAIERVLMHELPVPVKSSPDLQYANIKPMPLLPPPEIADAECADMLEIQIAGLMRRFEHSHAKTMVIGVSGGLDSTLALLVAAECTRRMGLPPETVKAYTMPGFGTTSHTRSNSEKLCDALNIPVKAIDITPACRQHFSDIGHDPAVLNNAYENVQARERTQILMDIANETGGMVIGTGDLSEMALGWCTYNGDHMSMYAVNSSLPKTLIRMLVKFIAAQKGGELAIVLESILSTPVSPELLPPDASGAIEQKTEDIIGPYELHDFFIWHFIKNNSEPEKIAALAIQAWGNVYSRETIERTLKIFLKRFFQQQFKRSCSPDGAQVTAISLSPRGAWQMPSDSSAQLWLD